MRSPPTRRGSPSGPASHRTRGKPACFAIKRRLDRLRELYLEGDVDKATYQAQKDALAGELAALPDEGDPDSGVGKRLAAFLADVAGA